MATDRNVLEFDGQSACVEMPEGEQYNVEKAITVEAWVSYAKVWGYSGIISRYNPDGFYLAQNGNSGFFWGFRPRGKGEMHQSDTGPMLDEFNHPRFKPNEWHHVAATYDGTKARTYFDGQLVNEVTIEAPGIEWKTGKLYIGRLILGNYPDNRWFNGKIAEVRMWKVARSEEEIRSTMRNRLTGKEAGLIGYWPLDDGAGGRAKDLTGFTCHGYVTNAKWVKADLELGPPGSAGESKPVTGGTGSAGVWIGNGVTDRGSSDGTADTHFVDKENRIGADGRVLAFRIFAKKASPIELVIYRKTADAFSVVGKSSAVTPQAPGAHELKLSSPIPVKAGDLVGWHDLQTGVIAFSGSGSASWNASDRVAFTAERGAPTAFDRSTSRVYSIDVLVGPEEPVVAGGGLEKRITDLEAKLAKCGDCCDKIAALQKGLSDHDARLAAHDKLFADADARLALQEARMDNLAAQLGACVDCDAKLAEQGARIDEIRMDLARCGGCEEKIAVQQKTIDELLKKIDELTKKVEEGAAKPPVGPVSPPVEHKPTKPDDLTIVEGIGPKIAELLKKEGIVTFSKLAGTSVAELTRIVRAGGKSFSTADPTSWPKQAQLAAEGKMDELAAYQETLTAGKG